MVGVFYWEQIFPGGAGFSIVEGSFCSSSKVIGGALGSNEIANGLFWLVQKGKLS